MDAFFGGFGHGFRGPFAGIIPGWNLLGMSESSAGNGATFTKTAVSSVFTDNYVDSTIALHGDGALSWTTHTGSIVVGLAASKSGLPGSGYMQIDFSIYTEAGDGVLDVIESGNPIFNYAPGYVYGDTFQVKVSGTTVTYLLNGVVIYTSLVAATFPLYAVGVAALSGSTIENLTLSGAWR